MGRGARKGLRPGALKSALDAHAHAPSPLATAVTQLARAQLQFSAHGFQGLDEDDLDIAVLHLWDVGACWDAWPRWAEARFYSLTRRGFFMASMHGPILATPGMEAIAAHAGRAIDAPPAERKCACVICAAAKIDRTLPLPFEQGAGL